jgi:uncharacterized RDD family membrane protein YckC
MFIIIGGDGKEYGPATSEQVRAWIASGRANLETRAKALGSDEWRRLGDFAEFNPPSDLPPLMTPASGSATVAVASGEVAAERGTRLLARVIDWALEFLFAIPGAVILGSEFLQVIAVTMRGEQPDLEQLNTQRLILGATVLAISWLVLLAVQVWLLSTRGQSIGKVITRIRIVRFVDDGKPGIVHAWLIREAGITVIGILLGLLPFVGPVMLRPAFHVVDWCMIFRDDRRCLHDLLAGTRVVKA